MLNHVANHGLRALHNVAQQRETKVANLKHVHLRCSANALRKRPPLDRGYLKTIRRLEAQIAFWALDLFAGAGVSGRWDWIREAHQHTSTRLKALS